mgnify:CR=1 FL=1
MALGLQVTNSDRPPPPRVDAFVRNVQSSRFYQEKRGVLGLNILARVLFRNKQ